MTPISCFNELGFALIDRHIEKEELGFKNHFQEVQRNLRMKNRF